MSNPPNMRGQPPLTESLVPITGSSRDLLNTRRSFIDQQQDSGLMDEMGNFDEDDMDDEQLQNNEDNMRESQMESQLAEEARRSIIRIESQKSLKNEWPVAPDDDFITVPNGVPWPVLDGVTDDHIHKWMMQYKQILIRTITWNLQAKKPPPMEEINRKLLPQNKFHLYFIGSEECERSIAKSVVNTSKKNWEFYLGQALGGNYMPICSHTLQATHLVAFAHRAIVPILTEIVSGAIATGIANTLGNKGGVAISMRVANTKLVVLNCHLAAHQNGVSLRNEQMVKIDRDMTQLLYRKTIALTGGSSGSTTPLKPTQGQVTPSQKSTNTTNTSTGAAGAPAPPIAATPKSSSTQLTSTAIFNPSNQLPPSFPPLNPGSQQPVVANVASLPRMNSRSGSAVIPTHGLATPSNLTIPHQPMYDHPNPPAGTPQSTPLKNRLDNINHNASTSDIAMKMESQSPARAAPVAPPSQWLAESADGVVIMGDLNYRIRGTRGIVDELLQYNMIEQLKQSDQLKWSMELGYVLRGYKENEVLFRPTYKFDKNRDTYDSGPKKRIPGWTDRILYSSPSSLQCHTYNSETSLRISDHRPVYASFSLKLEDMDGLAISSEGQEFQEFSSTSQVCSIM